MRGRSVAELSENPIVKDTPVLLETFDISAERFGQAEVMAVLQEKYPNAARPLVRLLVRDAERRWSLKSKPAKPRSERRSQRLKRCSSRSTGRGAEVVD